MHVERSYRPALRRAVSFCLLVALIWGAYQTLFHPKIPLPPEWNPTRPLVIAAPVTPVTTWKLNRTLAEPELCHAAMQGAAVISPLPDLETDEDCHIRNRVELRGVGSAKLAPVETRCQIALRLAMWEQHSLQPAAARHLNERVTEIRHLSSYSCRRIRTPDGASNRISTHASADAIDISGFGMSDGSRITLLRDWPGDSPKADFLRQAMDGACKWFITALGPAYNRLHADHFHLQNTGWGTCR